jgi:hypothetical protein
MNSELCKNEKAETTKNTAMKTYQFIEVSKREIRYFVWAGAKVRHLGQGCINAL